ncbi:MAG: ABC transporter permease [Ferruginibacter sp.]|nr:ABC transporter permease [Cytophagales bacterium]
MNFPLLVARRYFFSKYKRGFINVIAIISMLGVAVGTTALIFILSIFNGLEGLHRQLFSTIDADLKISARLGKGFETSPALLARLRRIPGVGTLTEVIEDNALARYDEAQMPVILKGVSDNFLARKAMNGIITEGRLVLREKETDYAVMGQGVQHTLSVSVKDDFIPLQIWYPRNRKKLNLTSLNSVNRLNIRVGGVFALEQQYDDSYVFVPLAFAQQLLEYGNKRTALEILVKPGSDGEDVKDRLRAALGDAFVIQNQEEQHASILQAIKFEKLFVYLSLSFIMAVASFNIFFSLTMLAIDKQKDVAVLYAVGATPGLIKRIFLTEGAIIAFIGAGLGLVTGVFLCVVQQRYGLISLGMSTSVVEAYPVKMEWPDFVSTGIAVTLITFVASYFPALKASRQTDLRA